MLIDLNNHTWPVASLFRHQSSRFIKWYSQEENYEWPACLRQISKWGKRGQGRSDVQMPLLVAVRGSRLCCRGWVRVAGQWRAPGSRVLGLTERITSPWSEVPRPSLAPQVPGGPAPGTQTFFPPIFIALCSSHTGRLSVPQMFQAPLCFWTSLVMGPRKPHFYWVRWWF